MTVNQLVAYNMAYFRKAAGLGQQEFGEPLGWSVASVSAAERSWDGKRIKKFDADEIVQIAYVLGVPLSALFLPPEDHGTAVRYVLKTRGSEDRGLSDLGADVFPAAARDSAAMSAYRKRLIAARAGRQRPAGGLLGSDEDRVPRAADGSTPPQSAKRGQPRPREDRHRDRGDPRGSQTPS